jgi:internalin A
MPRQVTDLTPIIGLPALKHLDITGTNVKDLGPVAYRKSLEEIYFNGTRVRDVRPLADLTELRRISFSGTRVVDPTPIEHLGPQLNRRLSGSGSDGTLDPYTGGPAHGSVPARCGAVCQRSYSPIAG